MSLTVSPTLDDVYAALVAFILGIIPLDAAHVIKGNQNRIPTPTGPYAILNIISQKRLRTNVDTWDSSIPDPAGIVREQGIKLEMQIDLYGPTSGDWAATFSTMFRDDYGAQALAPNCQPLHADEPTRAPLITAESQYLDRWIVRAQIQYNPVVSTIDQFADTVEIDVIDSVTHYGP
jgi:hypothetical protein